MSTQDIAATIAAVAALINAVIALITFRERRRAKVDAGGSVEPEKVNEVKAMIDRRFWISISLTAVFAVLAMLLLLLRVLGHPPRVVYLAVYDFENDTQGWGEHLGDALHVKGQGVEAYCDKQSPVRYTGDCSLKFTPTEIVNGNAYVTVLKSAQGSSITAYVLVPSGADISTTEGRSTAKIIVWDKNWVSDESDYVELIPGRWQEISWDLRKKERPGPWPEFGIHFWFITDYEGPIYIDNVTLTK